MEVLIFSSRDIVVTVCSNEVLVVKSVINERKRTCTYFKRC